MSRFREEMKVIPRGAWIIAILLYFVSLASSWWVFFPHDEGFSYWPRWGLTLFAVVVPLFLAAYVLLLGYVNADARRRGIRYVMWTLLAFFIPMQSASSCTSILRSSAARRAPARHIGEVTASRFARNAAALWRRHARSAVPQCSRWSHCTKCGAGLQAH